jgi:hypothetical protein
MLTCCAALAAMRQEPGWLPAGHGCPLAQARVAEWRFTPRERLAKAIVGGVGPPSPWRAPLARSRWRMCPPTSGEGLLRCASSRGPRGMGIKKRRHHRDLLLTADHRRLMGDHASDESRSCRPLAPVHFHIGASSAALGCGVCLPASEERQDAAGLADLLRMGGGC